MEDKGGKLAALTEPLMVLQRGPSVMDDGLPLLTDVVDGPAMHFVDGNITQNQLAQGAIDTRPKIPWPPVQRIPEAISPDIRNLVAKEVLRQLGELLPQIAEQAGEIAQDAVENYLQGLHREKEGVSAQEPPRE